MIRTARATRNAAFKGTHGLAGETNVQGKDQLKLDVIADETFKLICKNSPKLAALVNEEMEEATWLKEPKSGEYPCIMIRWTVRPILR